MATAHLTQRRVDALKPRRSAYDVRDRDLKGFGVRVLPSGARRYFINSQHRGRRVWKLVGQAEALNVDEARDRARAMLAAIRIGNDDEAAAPSDILFETVADEVFRRYARNWKPSTLKVNRNYYSNHILPWFEGTPHRRHHRPRRPALVCIAPQYPGVGGPVSPHSLGHHAPGRGLRLPAGGNQSVRGHQAVPPPGTAALPVDRRDLPAWRGSGTPRSRPPAGYSDHTTASPHRMPQGRDRHPEMAFLSRG